MSQSYPARPSRTPYGAARSFERRFRNYAIKEQYNPLIPDPQAMKETGQGSCMTYATGLTEHVLTLAPDAVTGLRFAKYTFRRHEPQHYQAPYRSYMHVEALFRDKGLANWRMADNNNDLSQATITVPSLVDEALEANDDSYVYTWGNFRSRFSGGAVRVDAGEDFVWPEDSNSHRVYTPQRLGGRVCKALADLTFIEYSIDADARREAQASGDYDFMPTLPHVTTPIHPAERS